jgi:HK97 family phage major capsid protein
MAASLNKLQDRAAAVAAMLDDLSKVEDRTEAQVADVEKLTAEAAELEQRLAQETAIAEKIASLRGKVAASAKPVAVEAEAPVTRKVQHVGRVRGFASADEAEVCGRWIRGYLLNRTEDRAWYERNVEERALSSNDNAKGGVLIPESFAATVIRLVDSFSSIPQQANVIPMSSNTLYIPRRTGGNTAYFVSDNSETTASDMATDNVLLSTKDCRVATRVPNSLIEDSVIDLADAMAVEVAQSFAEAFDNAGLIGDGGSTYHGTVGVAYAINDGTHSASVATATGRATFDALTLTDFTNLVAKAPLFARRNAKFFISPAGYGSSMLRLMVANAGNNAADIAGGANLQFLGFPVVLCHPLQSALTGTTGTVACLFGDMSQAATYGERRGVTIKTDASRFIEYDQTLTFATARVAMVAHDLGSASKAGPVCALKFG